MTVGGAIFWSTVLVVLAAAVYQVSIHQQWKLASRILGGLFLAGIVVGGGRWVWEHYEDRPREGRRIISRIGPPELPQELFGVRIGMTPVEVTIAKGQPNDENPPPPVDEGFNQRWKFVIVPEAGSALLNGAQLWVDFFGETPETLTVTRVCVLGRAADRVATETLYEGILRRNRPGQNLGESEQSVLSRLGEPTHESISSEGLAKAISYQQQKVAFIIEKGVVALSCVTNGTNMTHLDEYGEADGRATQTPPQP